MDPRPFLIGGVASSSGETIAVTNPFDEPPVVEVARATPEDLDRAAAAAKAGFADLRGLPAWRRAEFLQRTASALLDDRERAARTIALEAGKPVKQARAEVDRAVQTLRNAAEESLRIGGELLPLDVAPGHERRFGILRRFPLGPVACITPFNFPLNLVAHKVAPALAAGCPFVLKPASRTPLSSLDLAARLLECGAPPAAVSVLPMRGADAAALTEDPRIRAVSFTGSPEVGWALRRRAYRKRVILELGGNAGLVVDRSADLGLAAQRAVQGGFGYAGQSCVSVQRIFAVRPAFDPFVERLLDEVSRLRVGDPLDDATDVGPMISRADAERVLGWSAEAVDGGARILTGGGRRGSVVEPTVLTGTSPGMKVAACEVFGPVVVVEPADSAAEALSAVDDSRYGLQAGIFTRDLAAAWAAFERLEVGAVVINDVPTSRVDAMPYGGVKDSGTGREGPRWAIEDYTEPRLLLLRGDVPALDGDVSRTGR